MEFMTTFSAWMGTQSPSFKVRIIAFAEQVTNVKNKTLNFCTTGAGAKDSEGWPQNGARSTLGMSLTHCRSSAARDFCVHHVYVELHAKATYSGMWCIGAQCISK